MPNLTIKQSEFYEGMACKEAIRAIEEKYSYTDESDYFGTLVNFSTAKAEPYQRWVRYREGYSTKLVDELISRSNIDPDRHFIADPMVGSGSTIIAAKTRGYDAFGVDVNPYCKLVVDAKLLDPSAKDLKVIGDFLETLPEAFGSSDNPHPPLSEYFPEQNLSDLLALRERINQVENAVARKTLTACWFFILEACSNRKKDGNGLATRPAPVEDVIGHFKSVLADIISDYTAHPFEHTTTSKVYTGSACSFSEYSKDFEKLSQKKLGAIIFSPPYANAFDYYESYKMELLFGGLYSMQDYQIHKKQQIRNYRISYGHELTCDIPLVELLCEEIGTAIPKKEALSGKRDARTRLMPNMLRGYFTDMRTVLGELYSALDCDGHCYIVVDQSAYVGVIVPTDVLLAYLAEELGFSVEKIVVCRKASTSGQQLRAYPYLGNTLRESIICLKKQ